MAKGAGLLLLGEPEKDAEKDEPKKPSKSSSLSAAKALLSAVKAGDAEAVDEALILHYSMCESDED
jgi:DNA-binding GntR family transcriptional regulator